jgi:integrase
VHVRFQIKYVGSRLVFAPPKGGKERDVPLPGTRAARLTKHLEQWPAIQVTSPWLVPTGKPVTRTLVFTGHERTAINRNYYNSHLWEPALVAVGVIGPKVGEYYDPSREHGFHTLSHAYASWLLANGVDIRSLADYLGHADPGFTPRAYTHLMPSNEEKRGRPSTSRWALRPMAFRRSGRQEIRRRSTWRTRAGSGAAVPGRFRWCACSRPRWR